MYEGIVRPFASVSAAAQQEEKERLQYFGMGISLGISQAQLAAAWQAKRGSSHGG